MSLRSVGNGVRARWRGLAERHGGPVLVGLLCLVVALGFGLRLAGALNPGTRDGDSSVVEYQGNDSVAYERIAAALYEHSSYGIAPMRHTSDWSPGAPLLYAGVYILTGGVHPDLARVAVAILGALMVLLVYLIGRRLGGPVVGLFAAGLAAIYPTFIDNNREFVSEPIAAFTLAASVLGFLWASDRARTPWAWVVPGLFLGLTALTRPEYLLFGVLLGLLVLVKMGRDRGVRIGVAATALFGAAFVLVLVPWTVRNFVVLHRFVPITTGGGKALFVATYLPGDGRQIPTKRVLLQQRIGRPPTNREVAAMPMTVLLDAVARKYPKMERDAALGRIGRENFRKYFTRHPGEYVQMVLTKMWNVWHRGSGPTMSATGWIAFQYVILGLALVGLAVMALRRRFEALLLGVLIGGMTLLGGVLLAIPRRNVPLMPLVLALAATGAAWLVLEAQGRLAERRRGGSRARLPGRASQTA